MTTITRTLHRSTIDTPIGTLRIDCKEEALVSIHFPNNPDEGRVRGAPSALSHEVERQLNEYFAGTRATFDLPLAPGGTPFQRAVWTELARIPYGTTTSYRTIAERIGSPNAVRAVGTANGSNPIPIICPCHRVIGTDGGLHGFGGGLESKTWLLEHERACKSAGMASVTPVADSQSATSRSAALREGHEERRGP